MARVGRDARPLEPHGQRHRPALVAPARGDGPRARRLARRPVDRHRLGQEPGLPRARALCGGRRARRADRPRGHRPLRRTHQGPGRRPGSPGSRRSRYPVCARRPTTATPPPTGAAGSASTPTSSSPTPTCSTTRCCRGIRTGRRSCVPCATSSSTSATSTGVFSVRTSRRCCGGCAGWRAATARSPPSCSPPRPSPTPRHTPQGSSVCRSVPSRSTAHLARRSPSPCGSHRWSTRHAGRRRRRRPSLLAEPRGARRADLGVRPEPRRGGGPRVVGASAPGAGGRDGRGDGRGIQGRLSPAGAPRARARAARR